MWDSLTRTLLALTFCTGIVDAVSFLALGHVFAAMQTGNVIFLGLGIADAPASAFWAPAVALLAFLAGGALAALLVRTAGAARPALGPAIAIEAALLATAAVYVATVGVDGGGVPAHVAIGLLSLAMGTRNTVARMAGDPALATTVLNLTLTTLVAVNPDRPRVALGARPPCRRGRGDPARRGRRRPARPAERGAGAGCRGRARGAARRPRALGGASRATARAGIGWVR